MTAIKQPSVFPETLEGEDKSCEKGSPLSRTTKDGYITTPLVRDHHNTQQEFTMAKEEITVAWTPMGFLGRQRETDEETQTN